MKLSYKSIGWTGGNTVQFIAATTLARHILRVSGSKPRPFTYGPYTLIEKAKRYSPAIIVGSFEGGEIDALLRSGAKVAALVKVFDAKYSHIRGHRRIDNLVLYPVPIANRGGLEYLVALTMYFNISEEEVKFFEAALSRKESIAMVLTVLNAWLQAYDLFTTYELIDDPTPEDIDKVLEHLKKIRGYEERLRTLVEELKSRIVLDRGDVLAFYLGEDDPRRYMVVANEAYSKKRILVLASIVPKAGVYRILVLCNKPCIDAKQKIAATLGAECRGSHKRFTVRIPAVKSPRATIESIVDLIS